MKNIEPLERALLWDELTRIPHEPGCALNLAGVYQDNVTRNWAMQFCRRATRAAARESVQSAWYSAHSLSDPRFLADAVGAAVAADLIVVSVYAARELPRDLYVWVETWLPRRLSRAGALTALIGVAEPLDSQSVRTFDYLQTVAHMAQLNFIPQAVKPPAAFSTPSIKPNAWSAGRTTQALAELYGRRFDAYTN